MNPLDQKTILYPSKLPSLSNFSRASKKNIHTCESICELLRNCEPNLRLPYSLFSMVPPYIRIDIQLPPGFGFNIEVSSDFSYRFVKNLWMLPSQPPRAMKRRNRTFLNTSLVRLSLYTRTLRSFAVFGPVGGIPILHSQARK